jgi:hypothetical protein
MKISADHLAAMGSQKMDKQHIIVRDIIVKNTLVLYA